MSETEPPIYNVRLIERKSLWKKLFSILQDISIAVTLVTAFSAIAIPVGFSNFILEIRGKKSGQPDTSVAQDIPIGRVAGWTYLGNSSAPPEKQNYNLATKLLADGDFQVWKPRISTNVRAEKITDANPNPAIVGVASSRSEGDHCFIEAERTENARTGSIWLKGSVVKCSSLETKNGQ